MPPGVSSPRAPSRPDAARTGRSTRQRLLIGAGASFSVLLLLVAGVIVGVNRKFDLIPRLGAQLDEVVDGEARNYLVVGSDDRERVDPDAPGADVFIGDLPDAEPSGQRADAIMIVRVDPNGEQLDILSIPRDLWVPIAGTGSNQRINTAYSGGPQQLIDTIREDFDIEIHHYAEIDFVGFKGIVDAVDGVPMWFETPMRDRNSGLDVPAAGCVNLDGFQALAFVRARYLEYQDDNGNWASDPTGDLGRMSRQQVFMRRVAEKAAQEISLTDIGGLNQMADIAIEYLTIDQDLEVTKAINVARQFATFEGDSLRFHSLPVERHFTAGGADVLRLDAIAAQSVLNVFRGEPEDDIPARLVSLTVLNGSGTPGQAADSAEALEAVGFSVEETGDAAGDWERTTVRHAPGAEVAALVVARHITGGADLDEDSGLEAGTVILVTGDDFTTVLTSPLPPDDPALATTSTTSGGSGTTDTTGSSGTAPTRTGSAPGPGSGVPTTTTTTVVGVTPGEPPAGVTCD